MLRSLRQRLSRIEESMPVPMTAERFVARARWLARREGGNVDTAMAQVAKELSDTELESVAAEFEQIIFGSDTAARDAARREIFAAAGCPFPRCPELDKNDVQETEGLTW